MAKPDPRGIPEDDLDAPLKPCSRCQIAQPATPVYFDRDKSRDDGLRQECKKCRAEEREDIDPDIEAASKALDKESLSLLMQISNSDLEVESIPHIATILQRTMEAMGGAQGYARHIVTSFLATKPGSGARLRYLEMIMRLSVKVSESGAARVPKELLTDEDLEREIQKRARLLIHLPPEDINVKEAS